MTYTPDKWWNESSVAIVTGANKGIGFEIAKILKSQGLSVVVTARDEERGRKATSEVEGNEGPGKVYFHQLDIANPSSISEFASWAKKTFSQGIDILVNNAGIAYKGDVFGAEEAQNTFDINFYGTMNLTKALLPQIKEGTGRVVTVSSRAGNTSIVPNKELLAKITSANSPDELSALAAKFVSDIKTGKWEEEGWPKSMYGLSKLFLTQYCKLEAQQQESRKVMVNACCPGWCKSDMTDHNASAPNTAVDGADTPVWLALKPPTEFVSGKLWGERTEQAY